MNGVLTGDGAQVEVVPYDLLELVVQRALLELQAEVVAQVRVQYFTCKNRGRGRDGEYKPGDVTSVRESIQVTCDQYHGRSNRFHTRKKCCLNV